MARSILFAIILFFQIFVSWSIEDNVLPAAPSSVVGDFSPKVEELLRRSLATPNNANVEAEVERPNQDVLAIPPADPLGPAPNQYEAEPWVAEIAREGEPNVRFSTSWWGAAGPSLLPAFVASFSMIVISELGDKTFFIAALMAMRHSHSTVFLGAMTALAIMTVLSAVVGYTLPALINRTYTQYASVMLFAIFGVRMLFESWSMAPGEGNDELAEVEAELNKKDDDRTDSSSTLELGAFQASTVDGSITNEEGSLHSDSPQFSRERNTTERRSIWRTPFLKIDAAITLLCKQCLSTVFLQAFSLTFLAEWGDRSQIATIALAASKDVLGVVFGATFGHSLCTGIAVLGGKVLASRISERVVTFAGGSLFFLFAVMGLVFNI